MYNRDSTVGNPDSVTKGGSKEWPSGIRWVFAALLVLPLYYVTQVLLKSPGFAVMFDDLLGDHQKLPHLTRVVLFGWAPLLVFSWLVAALAVFFIFTSRRTHFVWLSAVGCSAVLCGTGLVASMATMMPLSELVRTHEQK